MIAPPIITISGLDSCDKTLATTIDDEPYTLKSGQVLRNADKQYRGSTTIRQAITNSINVVAVKLSDEITQELGYEYCQKFGISPNTSASAPPEHSFSSGFLSRCLSTHPVPVHVSAVVLFLLPTASWLP